jgi:hypothetical protein
MTVTQFLVGLALGAGAIALWINFRFPKLAPERLVTAAMHVVVAMILCSAVVPHLGDLVPETLTPVMRAAVVTFLIGLPALVYALLASIWVILMAQGAMRRYR